MGHHYKTDNNEESSKLFGEGDKCIRFNLDPMSAVLTGIGTIYSDAPKFHLVYIDGTHEEATCPDIEMPKPLTDDNFPTVAVIEGVQGQRLSEASAAKEGE